jgi:ABC-2 type transport system permease protein
MNTQSGAIDSFPEHVSSQGTISAWRQFLYAVRREIWEYRSLYVAPTIVAILFLVAFAMAKARATNFHFSAGDHAQVGPYTIVSYALMAVFMLVGAFYCLDTLYGERRDRSILFWKSLPVSDITTVLAKASIPLIILPLLIFVLTVVTQWLMLLLDSILTLATGGSVAALWAQVPLFQMAFMLFFHLVAVHGLQLAPAYCWLLLVSAWARRAPLLWAVIPPIAIAIAERIAFNTGYFVHLLRFLMGGNDSVRFTQDGGGMAMAPLMAGDIVQFFAYPGLWCGLAVAGVLLYATIRVRQVREPI